jgi:hypothetical protein
MTTTHYRNFPLLCTSSRSHHAGCTQRTRLFQSKATEQTAEDAVKFLNYCATHPDAVLRYNKSDMILRGHYDASYLSESQARSRAGAAFYMGSKDDDTSHNGLILATTSIMQSVLSSAAEAEIGALFENCRKATIL